MRFEPDGSTTTIVDQLDGQPLNTPNDLAIDRQGRIWFSNPWNAGNIDPSEKQVPGRNAILRADPQPDGTWVCKRMTTDTTGTNGLLISPDQRTLYMIQTSPERRELRAYDILEDGSLGRYIVLHQFGEDYRGPQRGIDGMCLDAEGNIVATAGSYASGPGPMIYVWDTKGRVLETHPMPVGVDSPTNCTFGDPDQRTLYITTGGGHLLPGPQHGTTWLDHLAAGQIDQVRLQIPLWYGIDCSPYAHRIAVMLRTWGPLSASPRSLSFSS